MSQGGASFEYRGGAKLRHHSQAGSRCSRCASPRHGQHYTLVTLQSLVAGLGLKSRTSSNGSQSRSATTHLDNASRGARLTGMVSRSERPPVVSAKDLVVRVEGRSSRVSPRVVRENPLL